MPKPRIPTEKAELTGRTEVNRGRFEGRFKPKKKRPIGEPYKRMTDAEKECWRELAEDLPWLHSAHRTMLRMACIYKAKMDEGDGIGIQAMNSLSAILSKLGASPSDESKVSHDSGESDDPDDEFFTTH